MKTKILSIIGAALALQSCATYPRILEARLAADEDTETISILGLNQAVEAAADDGGIVHLFLVHGMSNHPFGPEGKFNRFNASGNPPKNYHELLENLENDHFRDSNHTNFVEAIRETQFNPLVDRLASQINLAHDPTATDLKWFEDNSGQLIGYKLKLRFTGSDATTRNKIMDVHLCAWAPVTIPTKLEIKKHDTYKERSDFPFNRALKNGMVTWGLSDAAQYVGINRDRMRLAVAMGIESMARDSGIKASSRPDRFPDRFAFGAASLGSVITLDTLVALGRTHGKHCFGNHRSGGCVSLDPKVVGAMFKGDLPFYMFANQIPLLSSAAPHEELGEVAALKNLAEQVRIPEVNPKITVLAFNDPSDILGYRVPAIPSKNVDVRVVNVMTRNQGVGLWWFAVNPIDAHTGFAKTRAVVNLMASGREVSKARSAGQLGWFFRSLMEEQPVVETQPIDPDAAPTETSHAANPESNNQVPPA